MEDSAGFSIMTKKIINEQTPEERELEKKRVDLEILKSNLAQKELDLVTITSELRTFEIRYLKSVGIRLAELDKIESIIAENLSIKYPKDFILQKDAELARNKARESSQEANLTENEQSLKQQFQPSETIKDLYREIAKQIHPDLASNEFDRARREECMKRVNQAYQRGDEEELRAILAEWKSSPEHVVGEGIGAELIRIIRQISIIEKRIGYIDEEILRFMKSEIYQLYKEVETAIVSGRDLIQEMIDELDRRIQKRRKYLTKMA